MKRYFIGIILLLIGTSVSAREITGIVVAEKDSTHIEGALCKLFSEGNKVGETLSNSQGVFSFETDLKSSLLIEISKDSYNSTDIIINEGSKDINVGPVYLNSGIALDEVVVTGNEVQEVNGRTVIYPSEADVKASTTALSLFMKLPLAGLEANPINRSLKVDGGSPMILINGVPSTMDDFNSLQAKDIYKVEYSRLTPARYADKNYSGCLIITLKERSDGGSVYLWGRSAVTTTFMDGDFNFSYHQGPSQFKLSYNNSWRNYHKVYDTKEESLISPDFRVNIDEEYTSPFNYNTNNVIFKYNYQPSNKTLFSSTFRLNSLDQHNRSNGTGTNTELGDYYIDNESNSKSLIPSLDLFLRQDFNDKNSLEIEFIGTISHVKYRNTHNYDFPESDDYYTNDANSKRNSLISEINFDHKFNQNSSLSVGYQNTLSYSKNTYLSTDYTPVLKENNNYIYANYGLSVGKFYFSLSSGVKFFWMENDLNKRHFIRNLSIANISWRISNAWTINGSFVYQPNIPSLSSLTDYPQQISPYLIVNGNPNLKVNDLFNYIIRPTFQYKKFIASLSAAYLRLNNPLLNETFYLGDRLFLSQANNYNRFEIAGGDLSMRINNVCGFGANVNFGFRHYNSIGENWNYHLNAFMGYMNLWWNKGPITITYYRKFPSKFLNGYNVGREENGDALSIEYKPDNHWTISANWNFMFDRKGTKYPLWSYSEVNPSSTYRYIKNNANMIVITVSYNADFGTIFRTGKRTLNNTDNSSSLFTL